MKVDFKIELAALDSTHCDLIRSWRNDFRIWRWCRQNDFISDVEQSSWFERQSKDQSIKMYIVNRLLDGICKPVGVAGLTSIDMTNRRAEFSMYIAPDQHRKGFGKQALSLLLMHGFLNLGLSQIWGETFEGNPALAMFESLGFKKDGIRRKFYFKDGRFWDAHLVSIFFEEFANGISMANNSNADDNSIPSTKHQEGQDTTPDTGGSCPAEKTEAEAKA